MKEQQASYFKELTELRRMNVALKNQLRETEEEQIYEQERKISLLS